MSESRFVGGTSGADEVEASVGFGGEVVEAVEVVGVDGGWRGTLTSS